MKVEQTVIFTSGVKVVGEEARKYRKEWQQEMKERKRV